MLRSVITNQVLEPLSKPVDPLAVYTGAGSTTRLALNTSETCAALGISAVSLWRLRKRGLIRAVPHLRTPLFAMKELERFLKSGAAT